MRTPYRLGIDFGSTYIGWCTIDLQPRTLEPFDVRRMGVRIFPDSGSIRDRETPAEERRHARGNRTRLRRFNSRKKSLMSVFVRCGMLPGNRYERDQVIKADPYEIRWRGAKSKLGILELGRAFLHLNNHRGFKSNRKTDARDESALPTRIAAEKLKNLMKERGYATLGEALYDLRAYNEIPSMRFRPVPDRMNKGKPSWDLYPTRELVEEEFNHLWNAHRSEYPDILTDDLHDEIHHIIFYQRPLKPPTVGRCVLEPREPRAPHALPLAQEFRMLTDLSNLRIHPTDTPLSPESRKVVFEKLSRRKTGMPFNHIRSLLGMDAKDRFTLELENVKSIECDRTGAKLADESLFGEEWWKLREEARNAVVEFLLDGTNSDALVITKAQEEWGLGRNSAAAIINVPLPDGRCRLSRKALERIVPHMREGMEYAEAAHKAGYHHSRIAAKEIRDKLPHHSKALSGRIFNPTGERAFNQLRQVVNSLIDRYGHPAEIVIETGPDLRHSRKVRKETIARRDDERRRRDEIRGMLAAKGAKDSRENVERMLLWMELNRDAPSERRCIYTGEPITEEMVLSGEAAIDHILPFSRTLDDSFANKVLASLAGKRSKGERSPREAFGATGEWSGIEARLANLPFKKRRKFAVNAMNRFETEKGLADHHLRSTHFISSLAREYLECICPREKIWTIPGRLTAMLRHHWKLDRFLCSGDSGTDSFKNLDDHRHHAIDAFTVAMTSPEMLKRVHVAALGFVDEMETRDRRRAVMARLGAPFPGFDPDDLRRRILGIVVSHRPKRWVSGEMLEKTAYGPVDPSRNEGSNLVYRKTIDNIKKLREFERVRDPRLRQTIQIICRRQKDVGQVKEEIRNVLGIRHVRLLKTKSNIRPVSHGPNKEFQKAQIAHKNHHMDILVKPSDFTAVDKPELGRRILSLLQRQEGPAKDLGSVRRALWDELNIRDVRFVDANGRVFGLPHGLNGEFRTAWIGEDHRIEIRRIEKWIVEGISLFDAYQGKNGETRVRGGEDADAELIMRIHRNDMLVMKDENNAEKIFLVKQLWARSGSLKVAEHQETGSAATFLRCSALRANECRRITVDSLGRVSDPFPGTDVKHNPWPGKKWRHL